MKIRMSWIFILCGLLVLTLTSCSFVEIQDGDITLIYVYEDINVCDKLTEGEAKIVKDIFKGKELYKEELYCGFSDKIGFKFENREDIYCMARDTCPVIYIQGKDRYFNISEDEKKELYHIFERRGATFPCL